jgi:hypothetical protein
LLPVIFACVAAVGFLFRTLTLERQRKRIHELDLEYND